MNPHRLKAYTLLLATAVIWGIAGLVIKVTLDKIPADLFILYRFAISTVVSLLFFIIQGINLPKDKVSLFQLFLYCLLNSSISLGLLFWGTAKTSLLDMSLISLFGPLLLTAAGYIFLKDKITKREKIGTTIAFVGALLIGISPLIGSSSTDGEIFGNILIFLSLVSGAICGILAKKLMRNGVSPNLLANLSFVVGFITVLPFVIVRSGVAYSLSLIGNTDMNIWFGILFMAIVSGNLAYILNNMGQKTIELSEAAPFAYLYPIFSAILATIFLGDRFTLPVILGAVVTFAGVILAETKKRRYDNSHK
ncbi:MAG: DMT family transporter [Candidatus Woesebacteria bacterium]|nr:MAG: DMT family transporter [Candidatus Woesebacteria bacterium]